jgi:transcriptional regulator with XRE-family HTH domain
MTQKKIVLDSTGQTLAENVRRIREGLALSVRQLANRLTLAGRSISPSAIAKIERCERRVDTDDLMALAIALEVSPLALLLPQDLRGEVRVTGAPAVPGSQAWAWAQGRAVLRYPDSADEEERRRLQAAFWLRVTPLGLQVPRGEGA